MKEFLELIDKDINRCNTVLKENNYLEIVIAVEELIDKYKDLIKDLLIGNDRVWNYSKKDLENLRDKLATYKKEHIGELMFSSVRSEFKKNKNIPIHKQEEIEKILKKIEKIYYENISKIDKWNKLREYLNWISNEKFDIASNILRLINIVLDIA